MARTPLGNEPEFAGGLQEVAERTWAWIQPNGELGESNAGVVCGERESLLVDTLWDERLTRAMLDAAFPRLRGAPIATVVNTHGDGDHWYGNRLVDDAEFIATEAADHQMREEPPAMMTRNGPLLAGVNLAARLPMLPGRDRIRGLAAFGEMLSHYEFGGIEPRFADRTFTGTTQLEVGGRAVELIEVGPAHTPGDAIVWVGDVRVCFSADIVFAGVFPIMWCGPIANWIAALERIAALEPAAVVPGHGPVCGLGTIADLIAYWRWIESAVESAGAGVGAGELTRELLASSEFADSPWSGWRGPERNLVSVAIALRNRDGKGAVNPIQRIGLIAEMAALRLELERA